MKEELIQKHKVDILSVVGTIILNPDGTEKIIKRASESCADISIRFAMDCLNKAKDLDIQTVYNQLKQQLIK